MTRREHAKAPSPAPSRWPDLQHKYGKLGIPAVVAAVLSDDPGPQRRPPRAAGRTTPEAPEERR